jgi:hypothetical protein
VTGNPIKTAAKKSNLFHVGSLGAVELLMANFLAYRQSDGTAAPGPESSKNVNGGCHARLVGCSSFRSLTSPDRSNHYRTTLAKVLRGQIAKADSESEGLKLILGFAETLGEEDSRRVLRVINR